MSRARSTHPLPAPREAQLRRWLVSCLLCCGAASLACRAKPQAQPSIDPAPEAAEPDRLNADERLPEAETAFGLPIPAGMRLTRHFDDSAYFSGPMDVQSALEHVRGHVQARDLELMGQSAVFSRAYINGDAMQRLFRIEVTPLGSGSQVYIKNITPRAATRGLSETEKWSRAGRKPDGTPLDPNQMY
jgi:hypothetical protein